MALCKSLTTGCRIIPSTSSFLMSCRFANSSQAFSPIKVTNESCRIFFFTDNTQRPMQQNLDVEYNVNYLLTNTFTDMLSIGEYFWVVSRNAFTFVWSLLIDTFLGADWWPLITLVDVFAGSIAIQSEAMQTLASSVRFIDGNTRLHTTAIIVLACVI